jgi:hypothetical protein
MDRSPARQRIAISPHVFADGPVAGLAVLVHGVLSGVGALARSWRTGAARP